MAEKLMERVQREALLIWAEEQAELKRNYTRDNVRTWLLHWHGVCLEAKRSLVWAMIHADLQQALARQNTNLRDLFELYCCLQFDEDEVCEICGWKHATFERHWRMLVSRVYQTLSDRQVHSVLVRQKKQTAGAYIQLTDLPVKNKV